MSTTLHHRNSLLAALLTLESSTTLLLEVNQGASLKVKLESQSEEKTSGDFCIKRVVKLFFDSPLHPAMYCISYLSRENLTEEEYRFLAEGVIPIGKLFIKLNGMDAIKKRNIDVAVEVDPEVAVMLNVHSPVLYKKKYDYWIAERKIGHIVEMFNEESLSRIGAQI